MEDESVENSEGTDPALNFLSTDFDPIKALQTNDLTIHLPCPSVQPYDTLQQYHALVSGTKKTRKQTERLPVAQTSMKDESREKLAVAHKSREKRIKTVLDFMAGEEVKACSL